MIDWGNLLYVWGIILVMSLFIWWAYNVTDPTWKPVYKDIEIIIPIHIKVKTRKRKCGYYVRQFNYEREIVMQRQLLAQNYDEVYLITHTINKEEMILIFAVN